MKLKYSGNRIVDMHYSMLHDRNNVKFYFIIKINFTIYRTFLLEDNMNLIIAKC